MIRPQNMPHTVDDFITLLGLQPDATFILDEKSDGEMSPLPYGSYLLLLHCLRIALSVHGIDFAPNLFLV